mgnify:CR=1 FL=1
MINIFAEANCNRYVRDECQNCHVHEPLMQIPKSDWHLMPEQAQIMVDKILQMEVFRELAKREINLTGGEPSQNPHIVEIFKIFRKLTPNVRIHTNLDISSAASPRWQRLVEIISKREHLQRCWQVQTLQRLVESISKRERLQRAWQVHPLQRFVESRSIR